ARAPVRSAASSGLRGRRLLGLLGRFGALAGPRLVELDAPLAVLALLQREPRAEAAARPPLEPGHRLLGVAMLDEVARHGRPEVLARLVLPDHEAAARVLARPAREAAAVLDDLVPADR